MLAPRVVKNPDRMFVGTGVKLGPNSELKATTTFPGPWLRHPDGSHVDQVFDPVIRIGDRVTATAGTFVVFYPHDAHMPGLALGKPSPVRKVVVKVAV